MVGSLVLPTSLVVILKYSRVEEMQRELKRQTRQASVRAGHCKGRAL